MAINLFIGTSPNYEDREIEMIYEYSLRKNTNHDINITWMRLNNDVNSFWSGWNTSEWFTPFSGFRWGIPAYCNYEGRAIYTDVDMINLSDINELYSIDLKGKPIGARKGSRWNYEFCVMVLDCARLKEYIWKISKLKSDRGSHEFHKNFFNQSNLIFPVDELWNCLDGENKEINEIKQLHFTNMSTQPWRPSWYKGEHKIHPREDVMRLYEELKSEALKNGYKPKKNLFEKISYEIRL